VLNSTIVTYNYSQHWLSGIGLNATFFMALHRARNQGFITEKPCVGHFPPKTLGTPSPKTRCRILFAKFCPFWCKHVKVTANDKVGRFWDTVYINWPNFSYLVVKWPNSNFYLRILAPAPPRGPSGSGKDFYRQKTTAIKWLFRFCLNRYS